jgi:acetylornithine deacetylase/succinyl-diaminopimelate desuccinylase-like protein
MAAPEIAALAALPPVRRGREILFATDRETLDLQTAICGVPAPTGSEAQRAQLVADSMRALGLADVRLDDVGNVVGRWGGAGGAGGAAQAAGGAVVIAAHLDTVFGPEVDLTVAHTGSRLAAPGISDNARGLAGLLALARAVAGAGWATGRPIVFAATVGEEGAGDLKGARHLLRPDGGLAAAAVIALDGAGVNRVVHRALGSRRFRVAYHGPGGHSWSAYGVANAAHALGRFAAGVPDLPRPSTPRTVCSVVRMDAGTGLNSIPALAWAHLDTRSEDGAALNALETALRVLATKALDAENRRRTPGTAPLGVTVEVIGDRPAGATLPDHPLVQAALQATRAVGAAPELSVASTDANVAIAQGIPAIALGAGGTAGDTHLTSEWYDNTGGPDGLYRALLVLAAAGSLQRTPQE